MTLSSVKYGLSFHITYFETPILIRNILWTNSDQVYCLVLRKQASQIVQFWWNDPLTAMVCLLWNELHSIRSYDHCLASPWDSLQCPIAAPCQQYIFNDQRSLDLIILAQSYVLTVSLCESSFQICQLRHPNCRSNSFSFVVHNVGSTVWQQNQLESS